MLGIFTGDESKELTRSALDPHTTLLGQEASSIIRNDQIQVGTYHRSEIYHRARQIYYRGRRSSARRGAAII